MDKIMKNRSGLKLVTFLFGLQNMFKNFEKFTFLLIYHLGNFNDLKVVSELFEKLYMWIYTGQFRTPLKFQFHLTLLFWKLWKERKKFQKIEYFKNKKSFLGKRKTIFQNFPNAFFQWYIQKRTQALIRFRSYYLVISIKVFYFH